MLTRHLLYTIWYHLVAMDFRLHLNIECVYKGKNALALYVQLRSDKATHATMCSYCIN